MILSLIMLCSECLDPIRKPSIEADPKSERLKCSRPTQRDGSEFASEGTSRRQLNRSSLIDIDHFV